MRQVLFERNCSNTRIVEFAHEVISQIHIFLYVLLGAIKLRRNK